MVPRSTRALGSIMHATARVVVVVAITLGVLAVVVILGAVEIRHRDTYDAKLHALPRSAAACVKSGGLWAHGPFGEEICQRTTRDAGKKCKTTSDCEGACLGHAGRVGGDLDGQCSSEVVVFGCNVILERLSSDTVCRD